MIKREELLTPEVISALREHALEEYPKECVGLVLKEGGYRPLINTSDNPEREVQFKHAPYLLEKKKGNLLAFAHSHPNGPNCPSKTDMIAQRSMDIPAILISTNGQACLQPFAWGDELEIPPLVGRGFLHGVTDCYALIRDYFRIHRSVTLKEFPRDWEWWKKGEDLYSTNFEGAGFTRISAEEAKEGDCVLMAVRSRVPNHGGVLVENNTILHHLTASEPWDPSRLSRREPVSRWTKYITHYLRFTG